MGGGGGVILLFHHQLQSSSIMLVYHSMFDTETDHLNSSRIQLYHINIWGGNLVVSSSASELVHNVGVPKHV